MRHVNKLLSIWKGRAFIPALICAILSAVLMRGGFWSFLFLIPLGFMAYAYSPSSAWLSWIFASALNLIVTVILVRYHDIGFSDWIFNILYLTVMSLGFTWIMAGGNSRARTVYRFVIASCAGAIVFFLIFLNPGSGLREVVKEQAEWLSSVYISAAGADAVQKSILEQSLTPEILLTAFNELALCGGAVLSCFVLFFISRQAALIVAGIARKRRFIEGFSAFHAPRETIWALSLSLGFILIFRRAGIAIPEYVAWNVLVICGIIFLTQGAGITQYVLNRRSPLVRLLGNVVIIVVFLSPGINAMAAGILILLGIAENWLPLRSPKIKASTPGQ